MTLGHADPQGGHSPAEWAAIIAAWSPEERAEKERKFVRKIDFRLLPILVTTITCMMALELGLITDYVEYRSLCTL